MRLCPLICEGSGEKALIIMNKTPIILSVSEESYKPALQGVEQAWRANDFKTFSSTQGNKKCIVISQSTRLANLFVKNRLTNKFHTDIIKQYKIEAIFKVYDFVLTCHVMLYFSLGIRIEPIKIFS